MIWTINDIKECELVLGGVLRGVEFIYKEPGINRSLTPKDSEEKNLNKTNYRNQINKIALAIREIITSLGKREQMPVEGSKTMSEPLSFPQKRKKTPIITGSVILVFLIILGFLLIPKLFASKGEPEKSIVVLPFKNNTGNQDHDYLVQGQNDAMVFELCMISQVSPLRVLSGRTAAVIAGTSRPIPEIADEIDFDYIIEGSVFNVSDSINLQMRLIQAYPDEKLVWTQSYKSDLGNIFKLHHNIANEIAGKIGIDLTPENLATLSTPQTINSGTYKLYVRGMYSLRQETPESTKQGFDYLNQAISLDPADAFAHAALASGYFEIAHGPLDPGDAIIKGEAAALQAIKLDTTLAETYFALAQAYEYSLWKFREAEKYPAFIFKLGVTYAKAGKESEAGEILKRMNTLKPNPFIALGFVMLNSALNNKDEAFKWLAYEPHHIWLPWVAVMDWGSNLHDDPRFDEFLKKLNLPE